MSDHDADDDVFKERRTSSFSKATKKIRHYSGVSVRSEAPSVIIGDKDENQARGNWSGKFDFLFSTLSFAVGLGNVWRFPYQCYKNGGGAFVLPFLLMLFIVGLPLFFLETAFGQFSSSGVLDMWKACPLFQGIGYSMFFVSCFVGIYYNVIIAWSIFYFFASFSSPLPWASCGNPWNSPECFVRVEDFANMKNCSNFKGAWINRTCEVPDEISSLDFIPTLSPLNYTILNDNETSSISNATNGTVFDATKSSADEYFHKYVLRISPGFNDMGSMNWPLCGCLALAWTIVCLSLIKGIKTSGRVVYFTAIFPYVILIILFVKAITLEGSLAGIKFFFNPKWKRLLEAQVWCDAAVQIFFSLAPGWGGLITLSSYNKFKNNCLRDAYFVSIGDVLTSIFAGVVIFSIIGYMAAVIETDIEKVASEGPGLAFIVYPEVVTLLPISPLWAVMFFLMLITLGLGTQMAIVNTIHTTLLDQFPVYLMPGRRPSYLMILVCVLMFVFGISMVTEGGMYMLTLMDNYSASYSVIIITLTECLVLSWLYGYDELVHDIKLMLGFKIGPYWMIMWKFVSPIFLVILLIFNWLNFKSSSYRKYPFPAAIDGLGWCISLFSISCIPLVMLIKIYTSYPGESIKTKVKKLCQPSDDWCAGIYKNKFQNITEEGLIKNGDAEKYCEEDGEL